MRAALFAVTVWCSVIVFSAGMAYAADDASVLLEKTSVKGGLCLVVGARDTALAKSLAANSTLFVQVLQPDARLSMEWGSECSRSDFQDREKIAIRNAAFNPEHYGSDILNLIVVDDAGALGKAKPEDLVRMLTPNGVVAFKNAPADFAKEAAGLGCETLSAGAYTAAFRKPVKPAEWKICDSFKWRAGPRAQLSSGWASVTVADGKFFYRERMEIPGTLNDSSSQLFARDENNGRVLWSVEEDKWRDPRPLAAAHGRVYTPLGEKLVSLDGATGKQLFEFLPGGLGSRWSLTRLEIVEDLLLAQGEIGFRAFSLSDGKELWRLNADRWLYSQGKLITDQRGQITARSLKDPSKIIWQVKVEKDYGIFESEKYLHVLQTEFGNVPAAVATLDMDTGKTLWTYSAEAQFKKGRSYKFLPMGDKLYSLAYQNYENKAQDLWMTRLDINTGRVEAEDCGPKGADPFNMCAPWVHRAGKYIVYFFSVWVDPQANSRVFKYLAHPSCGIGTIFSDGMLFNIPSRKAGALVGISAMAPADIAFNQDPGGRVLTKFGNAHPGADVKDNEWPVFRANTERGNASTVKLGDKPVKLWEAQIGLGGRSFGVMSSERTGLTQAVCAYGLAIVSDIDAHRIVALDAATGKQKWVFPVGARVDYPPALYKGLCIFAARDGWVHCLNADDGSPVWKLLIAPRERLIGGHEKLESLWPMVSDVLIAGGVCYTAAGLSFDNLGGVRAVAFKPETGDVIWSQTYYEEKHQGYGGGPMANMFTAMTGPKGLVLAMGGKQVEIATGKLLPGNVNGTLCIPDDFMCGEISIPRNAEDRGGVGITDGRIWGKTVAFDKELSVAYTNAYGGETWEFKGKVSLTAKKTPGKTNFWENTEADMTVGDIVLTPQFTYCVGHYQRAKKNPELLVVSRDDGKVVNAIAVDGFPNYLGMSAGGNKLFVATREGKLLCYEGK